MSTATVCSGRWCRRVATGGFKTCRWCRAQNYAALKRRTAAKAAQGLCVRAGCGEPPAPGRALCAAHHRHVAALKLAWDHRYRRKKVGKLAKDLQDFDAVL